MADMRDAELRAHLVRVSEHSECIARALGLDDDMVERIGRAACLHDIGKLLLSDNLLSKESGLTDDEYCIVQTHTLHGARLLANETSPMLVMAAEVARWHHERWDGRGYPDGLSGKQIPLCARIVAVADSFDVMTHERTYKVASPVEKAVHEVVSCANKQFDPRVVEAFLRAMR